MEWKTREAVPPEAIQASLMPAVTTQVPLAAKPNSPSLAFGMPDGLAFFQVSPASLVMITRNLPSTGSLIATPCRPSGNIARQS